MNLLQESRSPGYHIRRYSNNEIVIGDTHIQRSLLLAPDHLDERWGPDHPDSLTLEQLQQMQRLSPELLILGTGPQRALFNRPEQQRWLHQFPGLEIMDTGSACRTYNLLHGEGRRVVAGLILQH
jgi:uncharacterized protein